MNYKGELMYWETLMEDVNEQGLPPGFRFHPTDEELVTYYLASKVFNGGFCGVDIVEVDLNRCEPWELPDVTRMGERERYFFSSRDRKYPTGLRTNRATGAGYWKATGKDREVRAAATGALVGMKKTLVFYKGRAPRGEKTKWVLHEYRLDGELSCRHTYKEEWVICRIFNKAGGDKKSTLYLEEPLSPSRPPNGPNPSLQAPFLKLHSDLQSPTHTLLQAHPPYYLHHDMNTLFPSSPPGPANQPTQEEEVPISIWLESYLQNPWISDTSLCSLGLPFGGGAVHDIIDMPMKVPAAGSSSIRIVDSLT